MRSLMLTVLFVTLIKCGTLELASTLPESETVCRLWRVPRVSASICSVELITSSACGAMLVRIASICVFTRQTVAPNAMNTETVIISVQITPIIMIRLVLCVLS